MQRPQPVGIESLPGTIRATAFAARRGRALLLQVARVRAAMDDRRRDVVTRVADAVVVVVRLGLVGDGGAIVITIGERVAVVIDALAVELSDTS